VAKPVIKPNPKVNQIFDDLENYLEFCRDYGYRYNEGDLYNWQRYSWQQFSKHSQGKNAKNMWMEDARKLGN
jgi:hypothetical protein